MAAHYAIQLVAQAQVLLARLDGLGGQTADGVRGLLRMGLGRGRGRMGRHRARGGRERAREGGGCFRGTGGVHGATRARRHRGAGGFVRGGEDGERLPRVVGGVRGLWSTEGADWKIESVVNGERGRREGNVVPRVSVRS